MIHGRRGRPLCFLLNTWIVFHYTNVLCWARVLRTGFRLFEFCVVTCALLTGGYIETGYLCEPRGCALGMGTFLLECSAWEVCPFMLQRVSLKVLFLPSKRWKRFIGVSLNFVTLILSEMKLLFMNLGTIKIIIMCDMYDICVPQWRHRGQRASS